MIVVKRAVLRLPLSVDLFDIYYPDQDLYSLLTQWNIRFTDAC
jgi:hypothetical protein